MINIFDLNEKQKIAFRKLKSAYKACEKSGILLVNCYGSLEAYNLDYIEDYSNSDTYNKDNEDVISTHECYCMNSFDIPNEWADDEHLIKLTIKGKKALDDYNS